MGFKKIVGAAIFITIGLTTAGDVNQTFTIKNGIYQVPPPPKLPRNDPRDNQLPENISSENTAVRKFLILKREELKEKKYIFIQGLLMIPILKMFGATNRDIQQLQLVCDNMNSDPHLKFRKTSMYRLGIDQTKDIAWRLRREPFILTAKEGFKRHDSGLHRFFGEVQDWVMQNSAFQALMRFKYFMMKETPSSPRPGCDKDRHWNMCGFFLRTITTSEYIGEPAAEGIHQDGVEFTMTTLFNSTNMRSDSAFSTLYSLEQEIGVAHDEADSNTILQTIQHLNFLDTLLFIDNEVSHSVTPVYQVDEREEANRDMGVFFTRRMAKTGAGFSAEQFDSENSHPTLPSAFSVGSKFFPNEFD